MIEKYGTYKISLSLSSALLYDDCSGISEEDAAAVHSWTEDLPPGHCFDFSAHGEDLDSGWCEITGSFCFDIAKVDVWAEKNESEVK